MAVSSTTLKVIDLTIDKMAQSGETIDFAHVNAALKKSGIHVNSEAVEKCIAYYERRTVTKKVHYNLGVTIDNQIVALGENELEIAVLGAQKISDPAKFNLPSDVTYLGYIIKFDAEHLFGQHIPLFYSSSWRTWYQVNELSVTTVSEMLKSEVK